MLIPNGKLVYIAPDDTVSVSDEFLHTDENADRARDCMTSWAIHSRDGFIAAVGEFFDAISSNGDEGVSSVYPAGDLDIFVFKAGSYIESWCADYLYIRNDGSHDYSVMDYDGCTRFMPKNTVTAWKTGIMIGTWVDDWDKGFGGKAETDVERAYREGYRDAMVKTEVARFSRIWTDECQQVNGGNMAPILSLFLATVDEESRAMVQSAILDKYRKK